MFIATNFVEKNLPRIILSFIKNNWTIKNIRIKKKKKNSKYMSKNIWLLEHVLENLEFIDGFLNFDCVIQYVLFKFDI